MIVSAKMDTQIISNNRKQTNYLLCYNSSNTYNMKNRVKLIQAIYFTTMKDNLNFISITMLYLIIHNPLSQNYNQLIIKVCKAKQVYLEGRKFIVELEMNMQLWANIEED